MTDRHAQHTTAERLEHLEQLSRQVVTGDERAIARQRERGKGTARERIEALFDPGTFSELDRFVQHRNPNFGMLERRPYGDGVITGHGLVNGRRVFAFSQDFTVFGGSLGEVFAEKVCKVMDMAMRFGAPVVGINDSGGARIQEGVVSLAGYADIFVRNVDASGVIPQISLVMGPCAGGAVYSPAITDFVLMVRGTSHMFITGPDVVKTVTGEDVSMEELGGADAHAMKSGVAHLVADSEADCIAEARALLAHLPDNNLEPVPWHATDDPVDREVPELDTLIPDSPNRPYDMKHVITAVVDEGDFLELQPAYAMNIVCGFARLGGHAVGIVGNQPSQLAGVLDIALVREGRTVRPHLRRVRRAARDVRRRARLPPRDEPGVGRDHPARREAALRVRRGDGAEADRDHAQGLRRRLRRDGLEAPAGRLQLRVADRRGGRDGPGRAPSTSCSARSSPRRTIPLRAAPSWSTTTARSSRTRTRRPSAATSTT